MGEGEPTQDQFDELIRVLKVIALIQYRESVHLYGTRIWHDHKAEREEIEEVVTP